MKTRLAKEAQHLYINVVMMKKNESNLPLKAYPLEVKHLNLKPLNTDLSGRRAAIWQQ